MTCYFCPRLSFHMSFFCICRFPYVETSAATGYNVDLAIFTLVDSVIKKMESAVEASLMPGRRGRSKQFGVKFDLDEKPSRCQCWWTQLDNTISFLSQFNAINPTRFLTKFVQTYVSYAIKHQHPKTFSFSWQFYLRSIFFCHCTLKINMYLYQDLSKTLVSLFGSKVFGCGEFSIK